MSYAGRQTGSDRPNALGGRGAVVAHERRSSGRVEAAYAVRFRGVDNENRMFREDTVIDNLSSGGVYLRVTRMLHEGAPVSVAVRLSTEPVGEVLALRLGARGAVLRIEPQADGAYGVAVQFSRRHVL